MGRGRLEPASGDSYRNFWGYEPRTLPRVHHSDPVYIYLANILMKLQYKENYLSSVSKLA